jgi:Ca-activated chloride channel homolog
VRAAALAVVLCLAACLACTTDEPELTLRVLASSDLADVRPLLAELRRDTGVDVELDLSGTVDAANALVPGAYSHDAAWLSSDNYFQLRLRAAGVRPPLATKTMQSPVVLGVKPEVARLLRAASPQGQPSWADIADLAATGELRFAMADPRRTGSGLAALVGVATAAAGTGGALRTEDLSCDRLRGLFSGQVLTAPTSEQLVGDFVRRQDELEAMVNYESVLLSLNAAGTLREPLELVYPRDGIVLSSYPMLLLDDTRREAYDRVTAWLTGPDGQRRLMEQTLRRPADAAVTRDPRLSAEIGNALYFPGELAVVDELVARYEDPRVRAAGHVIFVLDHSESMRGERAAGLRAAFDALSGAGGGNGFTRFHRGERVTLLRFAGEVLDSREVTVGGRADLDALRAFLATDDFRPRTGVWSALEAAYRTAAGSLAAEPARPVTVVLVTDGESNTGIDAGEFLRRKASLPDVRTYAVAVGGADLAELATVAAATGGRAMDAGGTSLSEAFEEIRGCA